MKKILSVAVAAGMMLGAASQASAYFDGGSPTAIQGRVILSMYDVNSNTEVGMDLGKMADLKGVVDHDVNANFVFGAGGDFVDTTDLRMGALGLYNANKTVNGAAVMTYYTYFGLTDSTPVAGADGKIFNSTNNPSAFTAMGNVRGQYYQLPAVDGSQQKVTSPKDATNGYWKKMNANQLTAGKYAGLNLSDNYAAGEAQLNAAAGFEFGNALDYVDMYVYQVSRNTPEGSLLVDGENGNDYQITVRLFGDGNVIVNPSNPAVPVPGALWLLGSGVAGLMGLRRRNNA